MSFTTSIKDELSKLEMTNTENIAELSAFVRNNAKYSSIIELNTENSNVAKRVYLLLKNIYGVSAVITTKKSNTFNRNNMYIIEVKDKVKSILQDLSIIDNNNKTIK